jgi:hypothetical protein
MSGEHPKGKELGGDVDLGDRLGEAARCFVVASPPTPGFDLAPERRRIQFSGRPEQVDGGPGGEPAGRPSVVAGLDEQPPDEHDAGVGELHRPALPPPGPAPVRLLGAGPEDDTGEFERVHDEGDVDTHPEATVSGTPTAGRTGGPRPAR